MSHIKHPKNENTHTHILCVLQMYLVKSWCFLCAKVCSFEQNLAFVKNSICETVGD